MSPGSLRCCRGYLRINWLVKSSPEATPWCLHHPCTWKERKQQMQGPRINHSCPVSESSWEIECVVGTKFKTSGPQQYTRWFKFQQQMAPPGPYIGWRKQIGLEIPNELKEQKSSRVLTQWCNPQNRPRRFLDTKSQHGKETVLQILMKKIVYCFGVKSLTPQHKTTLPNPVLMLLQMSHWNNRQPTISCYQTQCHIFPAWCHAMAAQFRWCLARRSQQSRQSTNRTTQSNAWRHSIYQ